MQFNIQAAKRDAKGKGASRRLRRVGTTPGIIYGGDKAPVQISLDHNDLFHILRKEAFHSSLISIDVEGSKETVLLRDVQWHPFRQLVLHIDFQRVDANQVTHVKLPLHFVNAELAPGVKTSGGVFSHLINEVDVKGLPGDMPAFIEVDVKALEIGASLHLRDVQLPKGLELAHSTDADKVIASIVSIRGGAAAAAEGEGEAQPAA